jgi:hypothetical protein
MADPVFGSFFGMPKERVGGFGWFLPLSEPINHIMGKLGAGICQTNCSFLGVLQQLFNLPHNWEGMSTTFGNHHDNSDVFPLGICDDNFLNFYSKQQLSHYNYYFWLWSQSFHNSIGQMLIQIQNHRSCESTLDPKYRTRTMRAVNQIMTHWRSTFVMSNFNRTILYFKSLFYKVLSNELPNSQHE